jgi:hypothetical protein
MSRRIHRPLWAVLQQLLQLLQRRLRTFHQSGSRIDHDCLLAGHQIEAETDEHFRRRNKRKGRKLDQKMPMRDPRPDYPVNREYPAPFDPRLGALLPRGRRSRLVEQRHAEPTSNRAQANHACYADLAATPGWTPPSFARDDKRHRKPWRTAAVISLSPDT